MAAEPNMTDAIRQLYKIEEEYNTKMRKLKKENQELQATIEELKFKQELLGISAEAVETAAKMRKALFKIKNLVKGYDDCYGDYTIEQIEETVNDFTY